MKRQWSTHYYLWFSLLTLTIGSAVLQPSLDDDDDYWAQRNRILAEEFKNSLGGKIQLRGDEQIANDILMAAKKEEIDRGFQDPSSFLPARHFFTIMEDIPRSRTFQLIQKMPKGGVLHAHDIGLVSTEFIYKNITFRDHLHICRPENGWINLRFFRSADNDTSCTSPTGWELLADLRANPAIAEDVNTLIWNALTLVVPDPDAIYFNINAIWNISEKIFALRLSLLNYLPVFIDHYYQGLTELHEDNVYYLEFRSTLCSLYDLDGNTYGPLDVARIFKDTTDRFVNDYPDFIGAKLIYASLRKTTTAMMDESVGIAKVLKKEFPEFLAGFDLVGQEDKGEPLIYFINQLKAVSLEIRLFLHAAETSWNGLSIDENLIDAVLLNATRIGDGYAILKHPTVMELARKKEIAIAVNPISHQLSRLVDDMRNHPASVLFAQDFPVVVSSDDPGLWGTVGLSYDFYEAFIGIMSRSADIRALKQLAINSIKYSAMSSDEKVRAFAMWEEKWSTFIADLVQDHNIE